jgi:hypothetical protein
MNNTPIRVTSLEHRNDVRIVRRGCGAGFKDETVPECLVRCQGRREDFQRHLALKPLILGPEYNGHSAPANLLLKPVSGDPRTGGEAAHEPGSAGAPITHRVSSTGQPVVPGPPEAPAAVGCRPWLIGQSGFGRASDERASDGRIRRGHADKHGQSWTNPPLQVPAHVTAIADRLPWN